MMGRGHENLTYGMLCLGDPIGCPASESSGAVLYALPKTGCSYSRSPCDKWPLVPGLATCSLAWASERVQDQSSQERTGPRVPNALSSGVSAAVVEVLSVLSMACRLLELTFGSLGGLGYECTSIALWSSLNFRHNHLHQSLHHLLTTS